VDDIMVGQWKKRPTYPKRTVELTPEPLQKDAITKERLEIWKTFANEDLYVSTWLVAPLAESIDWVKIRKAGTANHKTLFHWVQACLVMAAETAFELRRVELDFSTRRKVGGNASAFRLNRRWEGFAEDKEWKPRLDGIPTPINPEFGCGKHTSKKVIPIKMSEGEWSGSEEETKKDTGNPKTPLKYSDVSNAAVAKKLANESKKLRKKKDEAQRNDA
jgi:hypothetical protein